MSMNSLSVLFTLLAVGAAISSGVRPRAFTPAGRPSSSPAPQAKPVDTSTHHNHDVSVAELLMSIEGYTPVKTKDAQSVAGTTVPPQVTKECGFSQETFLASIPDTLGGVTYSFHGEAIGRGYIPRSARLDTDGTVSCLQGPAISLQGAHKQKPQPITKENVFTQAAAKFALTELRRLTAECDHSEQVDTMELLSATVDTTQALRVSLSTAIKDRTFSLTAYHYIAVDHTVAADGTMERTVELPKEARGWCALTRKSTNKELEALSRAVSSSEIASYHMRLGDMRAFRDGVATRSTIKKALASTPATQLSSTCMAPTEEFDWTKSRSECFPTTMDQQKCGSCWAFGASHMASARACIKNSKAMIVDGVLQHFSVQQQMSCEATRRRGCNGGWTYFGLMEYQRGAIFQSDYPYLADNTSAFPWHKEHEHCQWGLNLKKWIVRDIYSVSATETAIMKELYCKGPSTMSFDVYDSIFRFFYFQPLGVYNQTHEGEEIAGGHVVTLVGYGVQEGMKYWKFMNSWGSDWADGGFFKAIRGVNFCNFESPEEAEILGATLEETQASWMYTDFAPCNKDSVQKRELFCVGHAEQIGVDESMCPVTTIGESNETWPTSLFGKVEFSVAEDPILTETKCNYYPAKEISSVASKSHIAAAESRAFGRNWQRAVAMAWAPVVALYLL